MKFIKMDYKYKYFLKRFLINITKYKRISIGKNTIIENKAILDPGKQGRITIGRDSFIHNYGILKCYDTGTIKIGDNVSINPFCVLYGIGDLTIGNGVRIAAHTVVIPANHNFSDRNRPIFKQGVSKKGIVIQNDVWIASNVTVLDGVTIGKHSVIGAGSVVAEDVPDYAVAAGVPCKLIKKR